MARIRAVCGLGNPGPEYAATRHNVGFMLVERLADRIGGRVTRKEGQSLTSGMREAWGGDLILFKPQTFMNLSGHAAASIANKYDLEPDEILVVHDDADLPFGSVRIRPGGGSGGHRGIASITDILHSGDFPRLRIGIANEARGRRIHDFVLDGFTKEEAAALDEVLGTAADAAETAIRESVTAAMNRFNRRDRS